MRDRGIEGRRDQTGGASYTPPVDDCDHQSEDIIAWSPAVNCPACGYSLRGLPGVVVRCPECGTQSYLPELIAQRRRDWSSNRLYNRLGNAAITLPAAAAAIALPPIWLGLRNPLTMAFMACGLGLLGVWWGLLARIFAACGAREAIRLTVLMQVLVVCFLFSSLIAPFAMVIFAVVVGSTTRDAATLLLRLLIGSAVGFGAVLGGLKLCRYVDRAIGLRCIAWELEGGEECD